MEEWKTWCRLIPVPPPTFVPGRKKKGFLQSHKGTWSWDFQTERMSDFHVRGGTDTWGGSPGARILGCGPSCVTWRQSLPVSGPSIFISEMQSLACLRVGLLCTCTECLLWAGPPAGSYRLSRTREGKSTGAAGPAHARTGWVRPWVPLPLEEVGHLRVSLFATWRWQRKYFLKGEVTYAWEGREDLFPITSRLKKRKKENILLSF